jgi:hypothetical protein
MSISTRLLPADRISHTHAEITYDEDEDEDDDYLQDGFVIDEDGESTLSTTDTDLSKFTN